MKQQIILATVLCATLGGCGLFAGSDSAGPAATTDPAATPPAAKPSTLQDLGSGQTPAALNTTSVEQTQAALAAGPEGGERELGKVVVALGPPAEAGIWLKTVLVKAPAKGRVVTAAGASIAVDLIPAESGASLSLAAFQGLKLKLTDLPEVTVYGP
ncbi:MAG: hypothetical protein HC844_05235 [Tabrizicola sp.]|nr:hypothetical protein [Tabrizicola sp.]